MTTTMDEIADEIPPRFDWLAARGQAPSGPAFLRYLLIDPRSHAAAALVVQAGVPVAVPVAPDGQRHARRAARRRLPDPPSSPTAEPGRGTYGASAFCSARQVA